MTEFFAQPDEIGDIRSSDLHSSMSERLGAQAGEAFMGGVRTLTRIREYAGAERGEETLGSQIERIQSGEDINELLDRPKVATELPIADAKARVKQEGLEQHLKLPDQPTIKQPVLDLMIDHAHERRQYEAAVSRGPQGFFPDALGFVTEMGVGMIDPVNIAAFSIPVVGEARLGMMMARGGESILARTGVRAGVGAGQGALGGAALVPADWWLHTRDGQDYTYGDALRSVVMSAGMGAAFHAGAGALGDFSARSRGLPLPGSPEDLVTRGLMHGTHVHADALAEEGVPLEDVPGMSPAAANERVSLAAVKVDGQIYTGGNHLAAMEAAAKARGESVDNILDTWLSRNPENDGWVTTAGRFVDRHEAAEIAKRAEQLGGMEVLPQKGLGIENLALDTFNDITDRGGVGAANLRPKPPVHPSEVLADLPPRVQEDVVRASVADVINGNTVRAGELLQEAAKEDPRIAESIEAWHGSPHDFDAFDFNKIGTGEGAQAYGHGGYFAEAEGVGRRYRESLSKDYDPGPEAYSDPELAPRLRAAEDEADRLQSAYVDAVNGQDQALQSELRHKINGNSRYLEALNREAHEKHPGGVLYKVRINANREHMLDWDKPLSEQSQHVRDALNKIEGFRDYFKDRNPTGADAYQFMMGRNMTTFGRKKYGDAVMSKEALSAALHEAGIPGIKYLDQGSRPAANGRIETAQTAVDMGRKVLQRAEQSGADAAHLASLRADLARDEEKLAQLRAGDTHNFVVFDDKLIEITDKNGKPVGRPKPAAPETAAQLQDAIVKGENRGEDTTALRARLAAAQDNVVAIKPKAARGPRARPPETWSLLEFLADRGGISSADPLIGDVKSSIGRDNKLVPGFGPLIRKGGMPLDRAREAAVEAGYLRDPGRQSGGLNETTVRSVLDAIDGELRGQKVYREGYAPPAAKPEDAQLEHEAGNALDTALEGVEIDPKSVSGPLRDRTVEIMLKEHIADPVEAYERAVMEETQHGAEAGEHQRIAEQIPGWDVPDDAGAAPGAGGAVEGGGQGRPGEGAREPGQADRSAPGNGAPRADWQRLAARQADDRDLVEASNEAKAAPEVASTDPEKAPTAAEAAAKDADKLLADLLPTLSEKERQLFEDKLNELASDKAAQEQMVRDGAACLAAAMA